MWRIRRSPHQRRRSLLAPNADPQRRRNRNKSHNRLAKNETTTRRISGICWRAGTGTSRIGNPRGRVLPNRVNQQLRVTKHAPRHSAVTTEVDDATGRAIEIATATTVLPALEMPNPLRQPPPPLPQRARLAKRDRRDVKIARDVSLQTGTLNDPNPGQVENDRTVAQPANVPPRVLKTNSRRVSKR